MEITQIMTNKWNFDAMETLSEVQAKVKKGWLQTFSRWVVTTTYDGEPMDDKQSFVLDLSIVEVYWYTTHIMKTKETVKK